MAIQPANLLAQVQAEFIDQFGDLMQQLHSEIVARINRSVDAEGSIPYSEAVRVMEDVERMLLAVYISPAGTIDEAGNGLSPYSIMLLRAAHEAQRRTVAAHRRYIQDRVTPETLSWLRGASAPPPKEFIYDPLHLWVSPDGYMLSERIWRVGLTARDKLHAYLSYNIQRGTDALTMARDLEAMLNPTQAVLRSTRPYGVDVSFNAMRLARTEIARAQTDATFAASYANPFVVGMDWRLSAQHPRVDVCDSLATIGMQGQRVAPAYPLNEAPHVVAASHPQCICTNLPVVEGTADVRSRLEARQDSGGAAPFNVWSPVFAALAAWLN